MAALRYKDVVMLRDIADEKGGYLSACGIVKPECCLSVPLTAKTGQADRPCFPDLRYVGVVSLSRAAARAHYRMSTNLTLLLPLPGKTLVRTTRPSHTHFPRSTT